MTLSVSHSFVSAVADSTNASVVRPTDWNANHTLTGVVAPEQGGTGVINNALSTLTISGNFSTILSITGNTNVTLPTAGTLAALNSPAFTGDPTAPTPAVGDNDTSIATTAFVVAAIIEKLTANRTYYVRTDGSDSNTGLVNSAGGAFATIQHALDVAAAGIDLNGYQLVIQVVDGTYGTYTANAITFPNIRGYRSTGDLTLRGNTTTPANVTLNFNTAGNPIVATGISSVWEMEGFRVDNSGNLFTFIINAAATLRLSKIESKGGRTNSHFSAQSRGFIQFYGSIEFVDGGTSPAAFIASQAGLIECINNAITWSGSAATYSVGFVRVQSAYVRFGNNTFTGTFTGPRGATYSNSMLQVDSGSLTYFPGTSAVTGDGTGQYGTSIASIFIGPTTTFNDTTASTSTTTGTIKNSGGLGNAGAIFGGDKIVSVSATAGVGYATGAGGTITQNTNKSTGVTLDKVTGTITMNNAALNAGVSVGFTLTNSAIAATDVVVVNIKSGATADSYTVMVDAVAAGSCRISLRNYTAGNLSEAVVLSFVVIKGVAA